VQKLNEIEKYIVERLHNLEDKVEEQNDEISVLKEELEKADKMKALMRGYFILKHYVDGSSYIDHKYNKKDVDVIAEFIGLEMDGEEDV
jgi:hypothetical protein